MADIGAAVKVKSDHVWKFRIENRGELPRQRSDNDDERRLAKAVTKLKIRCTQSLGRQPSHALLNSAEKLYFTRRLDGHLFDGLWSEAVIEGNHLQFHGSNLPSPVLEVTSSNAFTMTMRSDFPDEEFAGRSYKAEGLPDGKLHWHDGDVWERCVGR